MSESIYKNDELENEMTLEMIYFWYSDKVLDTLVYELFILKTFSNQVPFVLNLYSSHIK